MVSFCKKNSHIIMCYIGISIFPLIITWVLQKYFEQQVLYGNCGKGVWILSNVIFALLLLCAILNAFFSILIGFEKKKIKKTFFYTGIAIFPIIFFTAPPLLGVFLILWVAVGLALSKAKYILYLFLVTAFFLHIEAFLQLSKNMRRLGSVYSSQNDIATAASLSRQYIETRRKTISENPEWIEGLCQFVDDEMGDSSYGQIFARNIISNYCYNSALVDVSYIDINSDIILIFDKPLDSSNLFQSLDSIKASKKKYLWLVSYKGDLFKYIPSRNECIAVLRENSSGKIGKEN